MVVLLFVLLIATARAAVAPAPLEFEQRLGAPLPLQAEFRDEEARAIALQKYFGSRPVILVLTYFQCSSLCGTVLVALTTRLRRIDLSLGKDFDVVVVSIDPTDTPAVAARKQRAYAQLYERPEGARGWHFLTGEDASIRALANAMGFRYARAERSAQYYHPAGVVLITP